MLRVGLTGDLGSGKSTVARMLAARGAIVLSSDEMGREMMQPGQAVYAEILERFGSGVVREDGALDRKELARLAFAEGRVAELNAIVHPAVIAEQARLIAEWQSMSPDAVVVVESALIFSALDGGSGWRERFDCIVLVTASEATKIARFVARAGGGIDGEQRASLEAEARRRLAEQARGSAQAHEAGCLILRNDSDVHALETEVDAVWAELERIASAIT